MTKEPWFTWGDDLLDSGFITVPNGLMQYQRQLDLSSQEINVILQVASYYRNSGDMFPSVASIAQAIGISPRHVRRINEGLIDKGYLELKERWTEGHRRTSNIWNFGGLISKLRTLMSRRDDMDVIVPPDTEVTIPPDAEVRGSIPNKEYTNIELTRESKHPHGLFKNVLLTDSEIVKLRNRYGLREAEERIAELSEAMASKGLKYKSHYATILNWERRRQTAGAEDPHAKYKNQKYSHLAKTGADPNDPDKFIKGKYGHMVRR